MADLLNDFLRESEREKHLKCYTRLINRARPYSLDDDATGLITELSSGKTIQEKLPIYRILARLPFDVVWMEFPYMPRFQKRKDLGTAGVNEKPEDAPDRMGWIMERITDTQWRATTVILYPPGMTGSGRQVDTFCCTHVISTEGPLEFQSFVRDPVIKKAIIDINKDPVFAAAMWGFGTEVNGVAQYSIPSTLMKSNGIDIPPSWEPIILSQSKTDGDKIAMTRKFVMNACNELRGDLRFLVAALATINETPVTFHTFQQPGKTMSGGRIRPYLINRTVTIAIPKSRGRLRKVMAGLKLAARRMRRHEVAGHWKNVRFGDGHVERRWIKTFERGDASLGFVRQEREVVKA